VRVSAVVTSYERPGHLARCLASLALQTRPPDEVVVADDGSAGEAWERIQAVVAQAPLPATLVTQEHRGYRAAASRNNGVRASSGELLLFADGDMAFLPDALATHLEAWDGDSRWTTGTYLPLTPAETEALPDPASLTADALESLWPPASDPRRQRLVEEEARFRAKRRLARALPIEAHLRKLPLRTCNALVPRPAFEAINGFDEAFQGWGCEDDDLALRLLLSGVWGRAVHTAARALHQYHPVEPTESVGGRAISVNNRYHKRRRWRRFVAERGLAAQAFHGDVAPEA
jgi:GT2 family glycosyltransferase